jgi:hypothetical protein
MDIAQKVLNEISSPDFLSAYDTWRNNPVTLKIFDLLKPLTRSAGLNTPTGEAALYYSGRVDACDLITEFLLDLRGFVERAKVTAEAAQKARELKATYGVTEPKMPSSERKSK